MAIAESQNALLGNSVNVAGKNRFLTSQFLDEVKDWAYVKNPDASPETAFRDLEENIHLLKNGGFSGNFEINELDVEFEDDWIAVSDNLTTLKTKFIEFKLKNNSDLNYKDIVELEIATLILIQSSDILVEKLGVSIDKNSQFLITLNISLLVTNIGVHILLILLVIDIFRKEFSTNIKKEKLATIGEFSARLAHDLRNPLSNINMSLQLLKNKINEKSDLERISIIEDGVERISHQVNEVMDFVKTREPNLMMWRLNLILKDSVDKMSIPNGIEISLPKNNLVIKCDKEQFEILFINLISNAVDSIEAKGTIKIHAEQLTGQTRIIVEDSGKGISEEYLDKIFEPLFTLKEKGTGLGLASCKNIVEGHGGKISASVNPTRFTITLPQEKK